MLAIDIYILSAEIWWIILIIYVPDRDLPNRVYYIVFICIYIRQVMTLDITDIS